ncbi:unnamed protein product [Closterium sp. NIES-54]
MHSRLLVPGLPRSLPSLPRSPAPPCLPCVKGRQRAAPHSSEFPPTTAPLQTLHMDVWGPAPVGGTDQERYFLLVVDDYTRYTTVFPLRRKVDDSGVLIPWICATRRQLREQFSRDFPVLRLHSERGGEFSSDLLAEFCRDEGIAQSFTLSASPQQNGSAERRIGLIMEVARTSMIHAAAPHFLWPFAVRYVVHQLNLWPRVSEPETSPTLGGWGRLAMHRCFGTAHALYDAVVARYSSPTTAALGRLLLPYLFPELSAFATVEDLVSHLCISDAPYRAALPADFLEKNPPPMYITLYFIITHLPDSLRAVRDYFLALDPTALTVDLLEQHLIAAETSVVAVGAARGTLRTPFFEGCSPSPLAPSYASATSVDVPSAEDLATAFASAKPRSSKGKGGRGGGGGSGGGGGGSSGGGGGSGGGGSGGSGGGSGGFGGGGGGSGGSGGSGSGGSGGSRTGAQRGGSRGGQRQQQQRRSETPSPQQLREWLFQRGASGGSVSCPYVIRTGDRAGRTCGEPHTQHRYFSRLDDAWRAEFGDEAERPRWAELLRSGVDIFDLDYDAFLAAMYALSVSAEGDCYLCVPPNPGIEAAALGASGSVLPGTAPAEALHTFTLDSVASRCFYCDSTTLTPLSAPVPVRLADPSRGQVLARSSTVLPCLAVLSVSLSGLHLPSFSMNLVSTAALEDAMVTTTTPGPTPAQVSASGQVAPPCLCRLLSHQTLLWHHRMGHPSLPRLRGMHSRLLVSGLPQSLPTLPPSPAPPCLPCVKGRQRAAPHSSLFPPTIAPLQTLHMDVWGPSPRQWTEPRALLSAVRLQLRERFHQDLPVLHSDRGGDFSSDLLRDFCHGEGILCLMEVARTSMIHAAAPHFLWPFAVRYAAHQLNLWPRVSLPETSPTLRWIGKVGDASVFRVWGSCAFVRDTSADKISASAIPCVFLGFSPDALGWRFYHPTSHRVFPSQDVTFDESVPFYRLFPYCSTSPPPPPLFLAPGPPAVDSLPLQAPSGAAPCAASGGAASGGEEPGGAYLRVWSLGVLSLRVRSLGVLSRWLREWFAQRTRLRSGDAKAGDVAAGDTGAGGAGVTVGAGGTGGAAPAGPGGARTRGTGAAGTRGVGGAGAGDPTEPGGAGAVDPGSGGAGAGGTGVGGAGAKGAGAVDPRAGGAGGTVRPRPYFVPLLQKSDIAHAASPTVSRLLATIVTDPSFESTAASALVAELVDFAVACRLDYTTVLVAESASASPPSVGGECALCTDVLEDRQEEFECLAAAVPHYASMLLSSEGDPDAPDIPTPRSNAEAITGPYSSQWQATMDAEMASWKSTGTYVDAVPSSWANIDDGMWIYRVFLHVAAQRDYKLHSLDFSTAFLQGSLHEEIWLRRPPGFTGSFPAGTQWILWRPVYGLCQAPREWHDTLSTTLAALGFAPSTADASLFLRTDTSLPLFYVLVYVDDLVFATADTKALTLVKSEL